MKKKPTKVMRTRVWVRMDVDVPLCCCTRNKDISKAEATTLLCCRSVSNSTIVPAILEYKK